MLQEENCCRIDDKEEAAEYGIESFPAMVYFDKVDYSRTKYWKNQTSSKLTAWSKIKLFCHQRIPNLYSGELDTVDILVWMTEQTEARKLIVKKNNTEINEHLKET